MRWTWGSPGEEAVWGQLCYNMDHQLSGHLDQGDGQVVRGGVEPLDGGDHARVVDHAQELSLEEYVVIFLQNSDNKSSDL